MKSQDIVEIAFLTRAILSLVSFGFRKGVDLIEVVSLLKDKEISDEQLKEVIQDRVESQQKLKDLLADAESNRANSSAVRS